MNTISIRFPDADSIADFLITSGIPDAEINSKTLTVTAKFTSAEMSAALNHFNGVIIPGELNKMQN